MKITKLLLAAFTSSLFLASCSDDDKGLTPYFPKGAYDSGVLILNQGGYGHDDASISYFSANFSKFENDIFSSANQDAVLGDTAQDICFSATNAYVVLNGSNKIEVLNRYTMKSVATIDTGLSNPRYMAIYNGKGYVTNWGSGINPSDDYVAVIDLSTNTIISTIPVVEGPERIIENGGKLYVAQTGGYGYGNQISVINTADNAVTTILVGDVPNAMDVKDGFLWVSCGGKPSFAPVETAGGLVKINLATNTVANSYFYSNAVDVAKKHPSNLVISDSSIFYTIDAGIYKFGLSEASIPVVPIFATTAQGVYGVYSFAIKGSHIFVGDADNYVQNGHVYVYALGNGEEELGTLEKSYTVGVIPAGFYFNY